MDLQLSQVEVRILASMMEKEATTPDYYPMTLNALLAACNQKSNRSPVMALDEGDIRESLHALRVKGLVREVSGSGHRVHKFGHRMGEVFNFDRREAAVLCVLMLRGPQTVGELRGRSERLFAFDDLTAVESVLSRLAERNPPLATQVPRRPGEKESRFAHLLSGEVEFPPELPQEQLGSSDSLRDRVARLESEMAELRSQFEDFRRSFE